MTQTMLWVDVGVTLGAALILAPLLVGIINKTKAFFAGRRGPSVFQLYFDLSKLIRKSAPRSTSSTWVFDLAPIILSVATMMGGVLILGSGWWKARPWLCAAGVFLGFYFLGLARFCSVLAARDVASAFPDMGSAREVQFSALVEAVLFAIIAYLAVGSGGLSVSRILAAVATLVILLSENCRVPFDDPETHLELTMIHEAMILDNAGPDLAMILYSAALKLWIFAAFLVSVCGLAGYCAIPVVLLVGVLVGTIESSMARMRFVRTPFILAVAFALAVLALVLEVMHG